MGINNKLRNLIQNGNTEDAYTREYVQNEAIPWLKREVADLEGTNDACTQVGLGPMLNEDAQEARKLLEEAERRWNL